MEVSLSVDRHVRVTFHLGDRRADCLVHIPSARNDAYLRSLVSFMRHKLSA